MTIALMSELLILAVITLLILLPKKTIAIPLSWAILALSISAAVISVLMITSLPTLLISLLFIWAIINNVRLITHRRLATNRLDAVRKGWVTFLVLAGSFAVINQLIDSHSFVVILSLMSLISAAVMLVFALYHAFSYSTGKVELLNAEQLPTLTLAYPARNETHALGDTLERAVGSDYSKLEIIVIDDCSQDRTPQIIRDFAHEGIRFVEGSDPSSSWLGKNAAYRTLAEEASGDYILFSGVDVRLAPRTVDKLVAYALKNNLDMVSVMPQRVNFDFLANFLQTTRYYFQFVLPWEFLPINPVLSSLWLIRRDALLSLGGFESVPATVVPERFFANALGAKGKYHFVVSDSRLGVTTRKKTSSQFETATRTLYPMLGENPLLALLVSLSLLSLLLVPFVIAALSLAGVDILISDYAIASALLLTISNLVVYTRFNASSWFIGLFNFPFIIMLEAILIQWSMVKYEFSSVVWKNRNICIPVLNPPLRRQRKNPI